MQRTDELGCEQAQLVEVRIGELAQELGTLHPVSPKRLEEQWAKVTPVK